MGLISFTKDAGSEILVNADVSERAEKLNALVSEKYRLQVENLSITIDEGTIKVSGETPDLSTKEKLILVLGNTKGTSAVEENVSAKNQEGETESQFYKIVLGDSLRTVSKQFYDDTEKYPVIFEANKPMLRHPGQIYPGQLIRIPSI